MNSFVYCPLCKKKPNNDFFGLSSYWYCKYCDLGWIKNFKQAEYDESYYKGKSSLAQKIFVPLANFFYSIRSSYAGNKRVSTWVDVGAGEGGFLSTVKAKKRIGVEVSKSGREMMKSFGLETLSDRQFLRAGNLDADVISFWHMLEHVPNPWTYLKAAKRNLRKDGKIIIGIPNIDSFEFRLTGQYWFHLQPEFHYWHFSTNSFKKLLEQNGFRIKEIDSWSIEHHPTGVLQSFINKSSNSKENILHKLIKRGTETKGMHPKDLFWAGFWTTVGLPVILLFWFVGAILKKSGTIVVVASVKN